MKSDHHALREGFTSPPLGESSMATLSVRPRLALWLAIERGARSEGLHDPSGAVLASASPRV